MFLTNIRRRAIRSLIARRALNSFVVQEPRRFSANSYFDQDEPPNRSDDKVVDGNNKEGNQATPFDAFTAAIESNVDSDAGPTTQSKASRATPESRLQFQCPIPPDHVTIDSPWSELCEFDRSMSFRKNNSVSYLYPDEPENVAGFLKSKRILSSKLAFATVSREAGHHRDIQVIIENEWLIRVLKKTRLHSVVSISGQWRPVGQRGSRHGADDGGQGEAITKPALQETSTIEPAKQGVSVPGQPERFEKDGKEKEKEKEYLASFFKVINQAPARPLTGEDTLPPHERVLQLRFYPELGARLRFRSFLQREFIDVATRKYEYTQITTPTLFKSTPEGAREFLVPTRAKGTAYALTQSPQQYKQALMAAGIRGYIQFAPCWRDEDLRQDRQPEFLQLDMEKAFTNRDTVMAEIQSIVRHVLDRAGRNFRWQQLQTRGKSEWVPIRLSEVDRTKPSFSYIRVPGTQEVVQTFFNRVTYANAMRFFGSDKPDIRIPGQICDVTDHVTDEFKQKITKLNDPIIEAWRLNINPKDGSWHPQEWIRNFMESLPKGFKDNPDGQPVLLVQDSSLPLDGFSSLGPEGIVPLWSRLDVGSNYQLLNKLKRGQTNTDPKSLIVEEKDLWRPFLVIFQARKRSDPDMLWRGASTRLGDLRKRLFDAACSSRLVSAPNPSNLQFLWVTKMPMFKPDGADADPGQGGAAGFSAAHHPFTAPLGWDDMQLLETKPLAARADAFDLVLNGAEVGGGSRRIHSAVIQEAIMRRVLKMSEEHVERFRPLLNALRYAPPHTGFAFGFDRLSAMLSGTNSIRDVIAFPKTMKGEDAWAQSPGLMTDEQLETYHLQQRE